MKRFDVQSIEIEAPCAQAFAFIADPVNLPVWAEAFESVSEHGAMMRTPQGHVEIHLETVASPGHGTIDWRMTFPDGSVARAHSRVVAIDARRSAYSFVLLAPPVPLEALEGALAEQSQTLARELRALKARIESHGP